jgi:hypothetical protein
MLVTSESCLYEKRNKTFSAVFCDVRELRL